MNVFKHSIFAAFAVFTFMLSSCADSGKKETTREATAEMTIEIEGMTCAKGCAKAIEGKIFDLKGVTFSQVDFARKTGTFKYDDAIISEKEILDAISKINDGIYKVTEVKVEKKVIEREIKDGEKDAVNEEQVQKEDEASV